MFRVTTLDLDKLPRAEDGKIDFQEDFFGRQTYLTVSGQLAVENFCSALGDVYTFRPDVQGGELQHSAASGRVLDGGARNGIADIEDDMTSQKTF